jgi:O-antigen/teichoic acid export membrane protein
MHGFRATQCGNDSGDRQARPFLECVPPLIIDETLRAAHPATKAAQRASGWLRPVFAALPAASRATPAAYSIADQVFAVAGTFLANVVLARTQTKAQYGMFALTYSVFSFLAGLHNAAILEPYTVYGSGRYRARYSGYLRVTARNHAVVGLLLTGGVLGACLAFMWTAPALESRALIGLGLTIGILLSGAFLRRAFYLQREADFAAKTSLVFLGVVAGGLWLAWKARRLDSFSVFLILALGWIAAGACYAKRLHWGESSEGFREAEPHYWRDHWNYMKWVLATALVFQLTTQGYYWLVAGILSVGDVAGLKAIYLLVAPIEQVFAALSYVVLPMMSAHSAANRPGSFVSLLKRYSAASVGATALFALLIRAAGRPVMHVLYAGKYDDLASLLFTLALLPVVMGVGHAMNNALKALEKPRLVFFAYACSGAATFLGGVPLVRHFGLRGAVYGMLLSGATYSAALAAGFFSHFDGNSRGAEPAASHP